MHVYEKKPLRLNLTSAIEQTGQVQVPISIRYYRSDIQTTENLTTQLILHLNTP
ncbi:hypothetical protein [Candidatus Parabeggiatoa sp. HSG14]|uniref:hypothetical protein n=1 Tax=Candidatus Parabeggiatoa sp. HSG14 TaxID=3055593 RepID=UPI0025A85F8F|nr:hypothetical protein [Thiotrichales bacterium HSG14]